jgi:dsRNA-specific ribonuclease
MTNQETNDIWRQNLASFLYDLLIKAKIIEENEKEIFFSDENIKIWANAFTHETYSTTDNYEDLEYVGDAILKAVFPTYLRTLFPKLNRAKYTEINIAYMSKMQQGLLSRKLGLGKYIRVANEISANLNLESDVFESFFGALFEVSNNVDSGAGYTCCFNMIIYLFNDITINQEIYKGANKSRVIQIFSRFKLENLQEVISEVPNFNPNKKSNVKLQVCLKQEHIAFLSNRGITFQSNVIGLGQASTKDGASAIAYENALKFLENYGITTEWAVKEKNKLDFSDPDIAQYQQLYTQRLKAEGYAEITFFVSRKTRDKVGAIVQIRGIKSDGSESPLKTIYTDDLDTSYKNAKIRIIKEYSLNL